MGSLKSLVTNLEVIDPATFCIPHQNPDGSVSYSQTMLVPCLDRCNWLNIIDDKFNDSLYFSKISMPDKEYELDSAQNIFEIRTFIDFDVLKSQINSPVNSNNCSITIYNLFGQKIVNYNFDISKGINDKSFSLNQLNTGLYIYHIIINGSKPVSNKFIIIK